jgi:UDP-3-O-[3-hydroxymyristoyl] glucosamine N-acyltransferase
MRTKDIAKLLGGELVGSGDAEIKGINGIGEARDGELAFLLDSRLGDLLDSTNASCVVVPRDVKKICNKPIIKVDNPSIAFSRAVNTLMPDRIPHPKGISPQASISPKARLGAEVAIGPYTVVEDGAAVGDKTVIYPFCYIGKNTQVGKDCIIYPNVTLREEITIGDRVAIHPGTVVGSDGFGYDIQKDGTHVKIPQVGTVVIEDDVELGACVTIDRARFKKTVIGRGTKIDNLVQIAHNVVMGPNCMIAAQTGISGSTVLGRNVMFGGQVGVADHLKIGDFVKAGAKTGISKSFPANTVLFWYPAKPVDKVRDIIASIGLLPKLYKRVRELEAKLEKLGVNTDRHG